jgi:uncharacterized 2Fe-2S/4Fe-4S cluster protein (DUF4445 family)
MHDWVHIELQPLGRTIRVEKGSALQDVLFLQGAEFPCGGKGRCRGCRIRVLRGQLPVTPEDGRMFSEAELGAGWRLACQASAESDLTLELAQWEAAILADHASNYQFMPREGLGVAVDLGTTTLVAQLVDLSTGHVLGARMALNAQARHGADVMSRIEHALTGPGLEKLRDLIRTQIGRMVRELSEGVGERAGTLTQVVIVGNTVMHHLFCGVDVTPLSRTPFEPAHDGLRVFQARELGWLLPGNPEVRFLPCLGGFVGSDILAGILATRLHESEALRVLIDLGTNGEIVVGNRDRLLCASTAAGPAFEGARISMGMRAATGAISEVRVNGGQFHCHVLGHTAPRGLCGSGLVDAVAGGLELGWIRSTGRLAQGQSFLVAAPVLLTQGDIRELQLAKGAIAAGVRILVKAWGATMEEVTQVGLAGAFGNYINRASARRIGLLEFPLEKVEAIGNTALLGAKLALFSQPNSEGECAKVLKKTQHISLHEDPEFQETYAEQMGFPG